MLAGEIRRESTTQQWKAASPKQSLSEIALHVADRPEINILNSPRFAMFRDTFDSCMKELKATGIILK